MNTNSLFCFVSDILFFRVQFFLNNKTKCFQILSEIKLKLALNELMMGNAAITNNTPYCKMAPIVIHFCFYSN